MLERTMEQEALDLGWIPKERYKGNPESWRPAEEFVERGREILPIVKKNNEKLLSEVATLRAQIRDAGEAAAEFRKYHDDVAKRSYERAVADLKAQKVEALENDKFAQVVEIDSALSKLELDAPKERPTPKGPDPAQDPTYLSWAAEHSEWLGKDKEKTAYATAMANYLRATGTDLKDRSFLDKVAEMVAEKFPEGGDPEVTPEPKPTPKPRSKVEGGSSGTGRSGGKTFAALPQEAREACDRFGSKLVGKGKAYANINEWRAQYVADYDWS